MFDSKCQRYLFVKTLIAGVALVTGVLVLALPNRVWAEETASISRESLMGLARQFVDRVGGGIEQADRAMGLADLYEENEQKQKIIRAFESIEDGEILLLQFRIGKIEINRTILGIKDGNDVMISLADFAGAADFAIQVMADQGKAEGFFIRENQKFTLDYASKTAQAADNSYTFSDADVWVQDDDIFVRGYLLGQWFDFKPDINPAMQRMDITSEKKWPVLERIDRLKKKNAPKYASRKPPEMPRVENPYAWVSVPNIDVSTRHEYIRNKQEDTVSKADSYSVRSTGDLLQHSVRASASGNSDNQLEKVFVNFSKTSEENDLLGSLKARNYEFGDINSVRVPYVGGAPSELGVRVSNRDPYSTSQATTNITGFTTPGWDVELYRNDQYVDITTADQDGQYFFNDVALFSGKTRFKMVQYGPQGQIEETEQAYNVTPSVYGAEAGVYDVSVSLQNTQTWKRDPSKDKDKNTPRFAGTYQKQLAPDLSVLAGILAREENEHQKIYADIGIATAYEGALLNADFAYDKDGFYKLIGNARKKIGDHSVGANASFESRGFNPGVLRKDDPAQFIFSGSSSGPLPLVDPMKVDYTASGGVSIDETGDNRRFADAGLTTRVDRLTLSKNLSASQTISNGKTESEMTGSFSVRGRAWKTAWRTTTSYELLPERKIEQYLLSMSRALSKDVDADVGLRHKPQQRYSLGELGLSWDAGYFRLSPTLSYDSDETFTARIATKFGLTYAEGSGDIRMTGSGVSSSGGVSARVFLDKNGDLAFDDGDELLEGVFVQAIHVGREAETDKSGEAFIYDLPTGRVTDVVVQESSGMDLAWVPAIAGISVRPRPGEVTRVDFPIVVSGEIDGTLFRRDPAGDVRPARNIHMRLYDSGGRLSQETLAANDGFYLFTRILPGRYLLTPDADEMKSYGLIAPEPQIIDISHDGTVIYGNDIILTATEGSTDGAGYNITAMDQLDPAVLSGPVAGGRAVLLNLGDYYSALGMAVTWYRLKTRHARLLAGTSLSSKPSSLFNRAAEGQNRLLARLESGDAADAGRICRSLSSRGIFCQVEIVMPQEYSLSSSQ